MHCFQYNDNMWCIAFTSQKADSSFEPKKVRSWFLAITKFWMLLPLIHGSFAQLVLRQLWPRPKDILSELPIGRILYVVIDLGKMVGPGLRALGQFVTPDNWMRFMDQVVSCCARKCSSF